jgi:RIP metalloprotease RseP
VTDLIRPETATPPESPPVEWAAPAPAPGTDEQRSWLGLVGLVAALGFVLVAFGPNVLFVILAIVASIFLHEAGHYIAARRSGMKTTEFFLGFGPRIWSFRRGETEYGVKAIWAGAYVRIVGMSNLEEVAPEDEARSYRQQSYPRRLITVFAGPAMNLTIAFVVMLGLAVAVGLPAVDADWPRVDPAEDSAAEAAGLEPGDELVAFDGAPVPPFDEFRGSLVGRAGEDVEVVYLRDGEEITQTITLGARVAGISAPAWPDAIQVAGDSPAFAANLDFDDKIISVDGEPVPATFAEFSDRLVDAAGTEVALVVERDGERYATDLYVPVDATQDGLLGVGEYVPEPEPESLVGAVPATARRFGEVAWLSVYGLYSFFSPSGLSGFADNVVSTPPVQPDTPSGVPAEEQTADSTLPDLPVQSGGLGQDEDRVLSILGIVRLGGQLDLLSIIWLIAVMNMFLAVFNLVPLLPFDGGHIAVATYERIREGLARRHLVGARIQGTRYFADFSKLLPLTYAVVAVIAVVGLGALWLDAIDPPQVAN